MKLKPLSLLWRSLTSILVPVLLLYLLLASNVGLQGIAYLALRFIPGLQSLEVQGRLLGPLTIQHLNYKTAEVDLQLQHAEIDWRPTALVQGNIIIKNIAIDGSQLQINPKQAAEANKKDNKALDLSGLKHLFIQNIDLRNITLAPLGLKLQLKGSLGERWHLQWHASNTPQNLMAAAPANPSASDSLALLDSLRGTIAAKGSLQGAKLNPEIYAEISVDDLKLAQLSAKKLRIYLATDLRPEMNSILRINAEKLQYAEWCFSGASLQAQGRLNPSFSIEWQLRAKLQGNPPYKGDISAQGHVEGDPKTPKITAAIKVQDARLKDATFSQLNAQLDANSAAQTNSQLQIELLGLSLNDYRFSPLRLTAALNQQTQHLDLNLLAGKVNYLLNEQARTLSWQNSALSIYGQQQAVRVAGRLNLTVQQYLDIDLSLPHYQFLTPLTPQQPISGHISLAVQQLAPFFSAVTEIEKVQGELHADLKVGGIISAPQLAGEVNLLHGGVDVPALNIELRDINLSAQGSPTGLVLWKGQLRSGEGRLSLNGTTATKAADFSTRLKISGENLTVANTEHYKIKATPKLQLNYAKSRVQLQGEIKVPSAQIDLGSDTGEAVTLSKDVVFVGDKQQKAVDLPLFAQIHLILGDDIKLHYEGLRTQLRGAVMINDAPGHPVLGNGQIKFHAGSYSYYGQSLDIRKGSKVLFAGAVDNPTLNIQAVKTVDVENSPAATSASSMVPTDTNLSSSVLLPGQTQKITVGVNVQGEAKNPTISLFAEPAILNQTDILSYLVVGQPAGQLGAGSASVLFNAVSSLNFGGGDGGQLKETISNIKSTLGVDFNVQSSNYIDPQTNQSQQNTALVLGKALSPRIYISYSVGMIEALNTLKIRYLLSKAWTLQSSSSGIGNGIDLLYMIEKG